MHDRNTQWREVPRIDESAGRIEVKEGPPHERGESFRSAAAGLNAAGRILGMRMLEH